MDDESKQLWESDLSSAKARVADVTVTAAAATQRPILDHLMQLYLHDFSEFAPIGSAHGEVDADGRFADERLDSYWQEGGRIPLLIRADDRLAGFALLNQWSALGLPLDRAMAEFFVLRKYRRVGVGTRAALLLFHRFPGGWEVPVAWYNQPALRFWRDVTHVAAAGHVEECAGDGERWSGTVLRFSTRAAT